mmetsp:Transcript_11922/g.33036  ORF Transcript_11922/g.33036 Transcript_11922/m.33036 type:complete len:389 (-) Transcript_11922:163-1329(-)|eukprot:CAMPEP_0168737378 /NCGR_PEP_ID=MMETSP0724-20121128/10364_1 /TAXON_ID=265536 /ORGANISM="Amphiprora sp., Strain CCMP467" /LENGTH=388 /DNA_ID=CAMNT_0008784643 /DNA_START=351 /DNA_END=1517 /DNA_ORIENTATION=+
MADFLLRGWSAGDENNNDNNNNKNNNDATSKYVNHTPRSDGLLNSGLEFGSMNIEFRTPTPTRHRTPRGVQNDDHDELKEGESSSAGESNSEDSDHHHHHRLNDDDGVDDDGVSSMGESVDEMVNHNNRPRKLNPKSVEDLVRKSIIHMDGKNVESLVTKSILRMDRRPSIKQQQKSISLDSGSAEIPNNLLVEKPTIQKDEESQLTEDVDYQELQQVSTADSSGEGTPSTDEDASAGGFSAIWNGLPGGRFGVKHYPPNAKQGRRRRRGTLAQHRMKQMLWLSLCVFLAAMSVGAIAILWRNSYNDEQQQQQQQDMATENQGNDNNDNGGDTTAWEESYSRHQQNGQDKTEDTVASPGELENANPSSDLFVEPDVVSPTPAGGGGRN